MSLGKNKIKSEIYSDIFTLDWELEAADWYDDGYYEWYDDYEYCTNSCCMPQFSIKERIYRRYLSKRLGKIRIDNQLYGEMIDMETIYEMGTVYYREKILRRLLGEEKPPEEMRTTLGDYLKDKI